MVQEHCLDQESCDRITDKMRDKGWDVVAKEAYVKNTGRGGGVAVMVSERAGVRPIKLIENIYGAELDILHGRFVCGITSDLGGIVVATCYGMSGLSVAEQLRLWKAVAVQLRCLGLPFVIGGDWQITPQQMSETGFQGILGASIVAPSEPTNLVTMRTIDFFVVSSCLVPMIEGVEVLKGLRFSPHAPVELRLKGCRSLGLMRRIVQPKPLEVHKPIGPMPAGMKVDWSSWAPRGQPDDEDNCKERAAVTNLDIDQWFAGAEAELLTMFGVRAGGGARRAQVQWPGLPPHRDDDERRPRPQGDP